MSRIGYPNHYLPTEALCQIVQHFRSLIATHLCRLKLTWAFCQLASASSCGLRQQSFLQTTHAMTTAAWAIRVSQTLTRRLLERRQALGLWPFWFFFLGMVWQLARMKSIHGVDVIVDSTTQRAWYNAHRHKLRFAASKKAQIVTALGISWRCRCGLEFSKALERLHLGLQGSHAALSLV